MRILPFTLPSDSEGNERNAMSRPKDKPPQPLDYSTLPARIPPYRKILYSGLFAASTVGGVIGAFADSEAARANILTGALGLAVMGMLVRSQLSKR